MIKNNLVVILSSLTLSLRCCCFFFVFFLKTLKNTGIFAELLCYAAASQYIQTPKTKPKVSKFRAELN